MKEGFKQTQKPIDWREPITSADGRTVNYVPPQPVADLLDNPTPENARLYIAWQDEKMKRIHKAQEVLAEIQKERRR